MFISSDSLISRFCRFRNLKQTLKLGSNVELYRNGLPSTCVGIERCKMFSSSQKKKAETKELLNKPEEEIFFKDKSLKCINEVTDLPNDKSVDNIWGALQIIPLNSNHILSSIKTFIWIASTKKFNHPKYKTEIESIRKSPFFIELCAKLEKNLTVCSPVDLYSVFQFALLFSLPKSSLFVNKIIVLILDNVNTIPLLHLLNIYIKIIDFEKNDLITALEKAIHTCLEFKQYPDDIDFVSACFYFSKGIFPTAVVNKLLLIIEENCNVPWSPNIWEQVLQGIRKMPSDILNSRILMKKVKKHLIAEVNESWPTFDLSRTCCSLISTTHYHKSLYNEQLFDTLAYYMSLGNRDLQSLCLTLSYFCGIYHFNYSLYHTFCEKFKENWLHELNDLPTSMIFKIILIFSTTNFFELDKKTVEILKEHFKNLDLTENDKNNYPTKSYLNILIYLLSLDIYKKNFIDLFFRKLNSEFNPGKILKIHAFFINILCQYVTTFHPEDKEIIALPDNAVNELKNLTSQSFELSKELENKFFTDMHVLTECVTPEGFSFSHTAVFNPDNTPLDISFMASSNTPIEISPNAFPKGSKIIHFNVLKEDFNLKFLNVSLETPWVRVLNKIYENLNYKVVFLSLKEIKKRHLENQFYIKHIVDKQLRSFK